MTDCVVKQYCLSAETTRGVCRKCKEYNKFERKKSKSAVAIGRSNKRKGKKSEKKLLQHLQFQGLEARIIEGSGAYKKVRKDADGDLRVIVKGEELKIENKKRTSFKHFRNVIGNDILHISGFCYAMNEFVFYDMVRGCHFEKGKKGSWPKVHVDSSANTNTYSVKGTVDRDYGWLHEFFKQDNADIVSLDESYKDFIFCISEGLFQKLLE